jgi:hypothetical protein
LAVPYFHVVLTLPARIAAVRDIVLLLDDAIATKK